MRCLRKNVRACAVLVVALGSMACTRKASQQQTRTEFGVFFGGQIQHRKEIPFQLNTTRQRFGFRVQLASPLDKQASLLWELSKPLEARGRRNGTAPEDRVTVLGERAIAGGTRVLEQPLHFQAGDGLGLWNLRVTLDNQLLLDQPFNVYDRGRRAARRRRAGTRDGGL